MVELERSGIKPERIVSGGQTGVDRAAFDTAIELGIECGGWCPKDRRAEDGRIPERYPLHETPDRDYAQRTEWNVRDSDGTLIICHGEPVGGTAFTAKVADRLGKPLSIVNIEEKPDVKTVIAWIQRENIHVLNIAGPRESKQPGMYASACSWLHELLGFSANGE